MTEVANGSHKDSDVLPLVFRSLSLPSSALNAKNVATKNTEVPDSSRRPRSNGHERGALGVEFGQKRYASTFITTTPPRYGDHTNPHPTMNAYHDPRLPSKQLIHDLRCVMESIFDRPLVGRSESRRYANHNHEFTTVALIKTLLGHYIFANLVYPTTASQNNQPTRTDAIETLATSSTIESFNRTLSSSTSTVQKPFSSDRVRHQQAVNHQKLKLDLLMLLRQFYNERNEEQHNRRATTNILIEVIALITIKSLQSYAFESIQVSETINNPFHTILILILNLLQDCEKERAYSTHWIQLVFLPIEKADIITKVWFYVTSLTVTNEHVLPFVKELCVLWNYYRTKLNRNSKFIIPSNLPPLPSQNNGTSPALHSSLNNGNKLCPLTRMLAFLRTLKIVHLGAKNPSDILTQEIVESFFGNSYSIKRIISTLSNIAPRASERTSINSHRMIEVISKIVRAEYLQTHLSIMELQLMNDADRTLYKWALPPHLKGLINLTQSESFAGIPWPFDPLRVHIVDIDWSSFKVMQSSQTPMILNFIVLREDRIEFRGILIKEEHTMEQDGIYQVTQRSLVELAAMEGYNFHHVSYGTLKFDNDIGFVEVIPSARSMTDVSNAKNTLSEFIHNDYPHEFVQRDDRSEALHTSNRSPITTIKVNDHKTIAHSNHVQVQTSYSGRHCLLSRQIESRKTIFASTCAVSSALTYLLGVGDRHGGNIMTEPCARLIHIDFGYMWGSNPKSGLGHTPVRLSSDMVDALGGDNSEGFSQYLGNITKSVSLVETQSMGHDLFLSVFITLLSLSNYDPETKNSREEGSAEVSYPTQSSTRSMTESFSTSNIVASIEAGVKEEGGQRMIKQTNEYIFQELMLKNTPLEPFISLHITEPFKPLYAPSNDGMSSHSAVRYYVLAYMYNVNAIQNEALITTVPLSKQNPSHYRHFHPTPLHSFALPMAQSIKTTGVTLQATKFFGERLSGIITNQSDAFPNAMIRYHRRIWRNVRQSNKTWREQMRDRDSSVLSMMVSRVVVPSMGDIMANIVDRWTNISSNFK